MNTSDRLMALVMTGSLAGGAVWRSTRPAGEAPRPRAPIGWIAVCDGSDSGTGQGCTADALAALAGRWARTAGARARSSFVVLGVGSSRDGATVLFQRSVPESWGPNALAARNRFVDELQRDLRALPIRTTGSALLEALHVASQRLHEHAGPRRLVVLSDLRQVTPGTWNFERRVPRAPDFQTWVDQQHLRASVPEGTALFVCGVHSLRGQTRHAQSARMDERRRALWSDVFARMGSPGVELHASCDDATLAGIPADF